MELEEMPPPTTAKVRRVVTDFDDEFDFYPIYVPPGQDSHTPRADFFEPTDIELLQTTLAQNDDLEKREDTPRFSVQSEADQAPIEHEIAPSSQLVESHIEASSVSIATPRVQIANQSQSSPVTFAGSQVQRVDDFPDDVQSVPSQDDTTPVRLSITPVKLEEEAREQLTSKRPLKRTYLESQTLDSLVTSVNLGSDRKRPRHDYSDKSFACLFGTVIDPASGQQKTEQQVFPKTLWPVTHSKQSFSDHTLASFSNGDVHIISIATQTAFEITTAAEQIFATVLKSSKDSIEVCINGNSNRITQFDCFKIPPHSNTIIKNHSTRLRANVQLVALRC